VSVFGAVLDTGSFAARLSAGLGSGAVLWIASGAVGCQFFDRWLACLPAYGRRAFGAAAGFALIGTCVGLLGLVHALSFVSLTLLAAAALACAIPSVPSWPARLRGIADGFRSANGLDKAAWLIAGTAWITGAIAAALPAVDWDPLAYHLPIAAAALAHGTFNFDPDLAQSAFPLLAEAAALPAFALAGSAGAAFAILGAGIALSLVAAALAERVRAGSGPLTCALVASSSLWLWIAPAFYVDVPFALFALAALGLALTLDDLNAHSASLIGLFAGAAAAMKYPGLEIVVIAIVIVAWRAARPARWPAIAAFAGSAAAVAGGWYVRSFALTGDPVYPFATGLLGRPADTQAFASRYVSMTSDWCGGHATFADFALLPWRLLTGPQLYCGDQGYALRLAAVLFAAALFVPRARPFATLTIVLVTLWFWTSRQWRFLTTAVATYAIAAAAGLDALAERHRPMIVGALLLLSASSVVLNWLPQPGRDASNSLAPGFAYIAGAETGHEYLSRRLEGYDAGAWALARLAPGDRMASLDDVRSYYLGPAAVDLNPYYQAQWQLDWSAPPAQRYRALSAARVKYLIVNENRAYLARTPVDVDWTTLAADERARAIQRVFAENDVVVYELAPDAGSP
jgi:hypothetical protein